MGLGGALRLRRWYFLTLIAFSVTIYTALAPFGYALFALFTLFPARAPERRIRRVQGVVGWAMRFFHWWLRIVGLVQFRPAQLAGQLAKEAVNGPCVVVANHPTLTDSTALLGAIPGACTAVRSDLFNTPWLRPLLAGSGHFDAGLANPLGGGRFLENATERLHQGFRVLAFPEGTRSPRGGLGHFGRSAFEAACLAQVPVVALLIRENPQFLAKGQGLFGHPAAVPRKQVRILQILHPKDFSEDSRRMRDYLESRYRQALAENDPLVGNRAPSLE